MNTVYSGSYPTTRQISTKDEIGNIDIKGKNAKQISKLVNSDYSGKTLSTQESEAYLIGDKLYTKANGKLTESAISNPAKAFQECDKLKGIVGLIASSDIEVVGTEIVDGQRCYKLRIYPEQHAANSMLIDLALLTYSSVSATLPAISSNDLSESSSLLDSSNISYTIWITSATCLPKVVNAEIKFALTPASLKGGSDSMPYFRIDAVTNETLAFSGFNVPENIEVPTDAESPPEKH